MIQNPSKWALGLLLFSIFSCSKHIKPNTYYSPDFKNGGVERHDGLGFEIPVKYAIDVFYFNETPKQAFELIESISFSSEVPLNADQTQNGKMLYRGMHQNKKKELMEMMVTKAEEIGASALVDVKYSVYSTKDASGYQFTGKAVRYVVK
jgi:hypothetical protein